MTTDYLPCHVHGSWQHTVFSSRETREHADPIEGGLIERSEKVRCASNSGPRPSDGPQVLCGQKDTCAGVHFSLVTGS